MISEDEIRALVAGAIANNDPREAVTKIMSLIENERSDLLDQARYDADRRDD